MSQSISFVSLGPGEAELITLKGWKTLREADLIFCPGTPGTVPGKQKSHAARILRELEIAPDRIRLFTLPMSKQREEALRVYDQVRQEATEAFREQKRVCIVAEGDAGFYASIHYIYEKMSADGIPVRHLPGIPAFIAAGARGGLHLASGEERLLVIPGTATPEEIERHVAHGDVAVIMKLSQCAGEVRKCMKAHPEYEYHYFEKVGTEEEVYTNEVSRIETAGFPYFSLMVIRPKRQISGDF